MLIVAVCEVVVKSRWVGEEGKRRWNATRRRGVEAWRSRPVVVLTKLACSCAREVGDSALEVSVVRVEKHE